jgi:hypothetical protein
MTGSIMPAGTGAHPDAAHGLARSAPKIPGLEAIINRYASVGLDPRLHRTESPLPRSLAARLQVLAPVDVGLADFLDQLEAALSDPSRYEDSLSEDGEMDPDTPVQFAPAGMAQSCMQALVDDFSRRQRQATMLVAGCITVSCILTFVGIAAIGSFAASAAADKVASQTRLSSAATWSKPEDAVPSISLVAASPNRAGKSDALLLPARLASSAGVAGSQAPAFVLMQAGRPLALGPIIAARQASYLLIRGLPDEAWRSSGHRQATRAGGVRSHHPSALS